MPATPWRMKRKSQSGAAVRSAGSSTRRGPAAAASATAARAGASASRGAGRIHANSGNAPVIASSVNGWSRLTRKGGRGGGGGGGGLLGPMARRASGKRAAVRRGRACSTAATNAKLTALSPKSDTKLPKKQAPSAEKPSDLPSAVASAIPPVVLQPKI